MTLEPTAISGPPPLDHIASTMWDYVNPVLSPIAIVESDDIRDPPGEHKGTGQFICLNGRRHLLTCEHVLLHSEAGRFICSQFRAEYALTVANPFLRALHPIDAAASPLSERSWTLVQHEARCVCSSMFAQMHKPVEGEYLYLHGFPQSEVKALFGEHHQRGFGVIAHECDYDPVLEVEIPKVIPGYHLCLNSSPAYASAILGSTMDLPRTRGMSGSLLWNTRYKEITDQGGQWRAEHARVTGLVWGESTKARKFIATPIEYIHPFLATL